MHHNSEQPASFRNAVSDLDIRPARLRIAARVVVHQNQCAGTNIERLPNDFAGVDCRLVN